MRARLSSGLALLIFIASAGAAAAAGPIAVTDAGRVQGAVIDGVKSWKGIPFAAPPVGAMRWQPPQPLVSWGGVREATHFGHDCMQLPFPSDAAPLGTEPSEDCLVLNVWAPQPKLKQTGLPVVAWIYGGGFVNGGSSPPTYSGENIARKGVVFVSFNYRLGRFGTFLFPQLAAQGSDGEMQGGNYGFMDQLAALRWIQRNIAAFGGDPNNVTLVGESAGGMSVLTLLTSPMARGLFQRAVVMSGGNGEAAGSGRDRAEQTSIACAASKGISQNDPDALQKLRALPAGSVVDGLNLATGAAGRALFSGPFVDGQLAVEPASAIASGRFAHVPVMIGATSNDIGGPTGYMIAGADALASRISAAGVPTFQYRFSYVATSLGKTGAEHASDIPFFFDTEAIKYGAKTTPRDREMGGMISRYLVNFARTGDPNAPGFPRWPRYSPAVKTIMNFDQDGRAVPMKNPADTHVQTSQPAG